MTIYGEYLFIENFITTLLLLLLTGRLTGDVSRRWRLVASSVLGAMCSFVILVSMSVVLSMIIRILVGMACIYIAFGFRRILLKTATYFILTFTSGGMVMAILLWMQESAINHQGIVYMESVTYLKLLSIGTLAFGCTYWFIKLIRSHRLGTALTGKVCIVMDGIEYFFNAYVDSGNYLRDPLSDRPVILIDKIGAKKLHDFRKSFPEKFSLIPYKAVGVENGLLESYRTDKIIYDGKETSGVMLGFYEGVFSGYEVLLNRDFLEGGLFEKNN